MACGSGSDMKFSESTSDELRLISRGRRDSAGRGRSNGSKLDQQDVTQSGTLAGAASLKLRAVLKSNFSFFRGSVPNIIGDV